MNKEFFLKKIKSNIDTSGIHISIVTGTQEPRYAYTIGNNEKNNCELIFAGGAFFLKDQVLKILNKISVKLTEENIENFDKQEFYFDHLGSFSLKKVHKSWSQLTMLGVYDYYNLNEISAYQVIPDNEHHTIDIPDMTVEWNSNSKSPWKWLKEDWQYNIPKDISVVTNLEALKGQSITEVMRWEKDEWEMFAGDGSNVKEEDIRVIPIGLLLAFDKSLEDSLNLEVGEGFWRASKNDKWEKWITSEEN